MHLLLDAFLRDRMVDVDLPSVEADAQSPADNREDRPEEAAAGNEPEDD